MNSRWNPVTTPVVAPVYEGAIDLVLTPSERSKVASFAVAVEAQRRRQNELDRKQQAAANRAQQARMGIEWDGPDAA